MNGWNGSRRLGVAMGLVALVAGLTVVPAHATPAEAPSTSATVTFALGLNPGLGAGKPFACPAIQHATATITVTNRFVTGAQNDPMVLRASGLPHSTGFDVFI